MVGIKETGAPPPGRLEAPLAHRWPLGRTRISAVSRLPSPTPYFPRGQGGPGDTSLAASWPRTPLSLYQTQHLGDRPASEPPGRLRPVGEAPGGLLPPSPACMAT